ncbi:ribosome maturation factor RimM [Trichlorobacter ammonificans]|uniref:Ribosome maturation factor RimM n=1 Tax=Trichlorobacter ammonificans TaxID=2916410 RepID=A0ABM9DAD6_9BACT|nr:ribosome maturation factor RimM [Trichlorobacter ammonificans]CAH2031586.1 Ribosome maturation factor RimM [Trichlorobacter ammonificans]
MEHERTTLIAVGRISGPHGVRGQLRLHSYSGNIETLQAAREIRLAMADGTMGRFRLTRAVQHGSKMLLTIAGIDSADAAGRLAGAELLVDQDQLPAAGDDEYYWKDLIGLTVVTDQGMRLGTLSRIMETGANDVYVVEGEEKEYLIPAIADVIQTVDLSAGIMTITPLEGLLDL